LKIIYNLMHFLKLKHNNVIQFIHIVKLLMSFNKYLKMYILPT